ncbi:acetamidase/formamidase family protein [Amnibacterium kyonggiense]|uniref:Acetamidase/formamidase n=1 Tax=Amnibacterium kyonggiense TaxID=595671 RepID=A0A4R7FPJ9_9MICO|nr:acetamidase/formamidase family protein [Amnibacterium kyonggiense]TDS79586.1 acetamidase/formamidase [Amnibacterium kyonggiense]
MRFDLSSWTAVQPGSDAETYLPSTPETVLWGRLPCADDEPVLSVASGAVVTVDTLSHEGLLPDQGQDPLAFFAREGVPPQLVLEDAVRIAAERVHDEADGPHVVTGPIAVRGARPGDLLRIDVLELEPRVPYGVVSNRHGRGALPGEYPEGPDAVSVFAAVEERDDGWAGVLPRRAGSDAVARFPLAPFLGIMGVAVAGRARPHSVPPGAHGGNIDVKLLVEGTALLLPVQVDDALAYVGDPHFAQGDGEVALTAMEASLRATLRFSVVPRSQALEAYGVVTGPLVVTPEYLVPTGLSEDLDEAVQHAVRAAIELLHARFGMDRSNALAYLSAATDFDISQVVDLVKGVHAKIRIADFDA